MKLKVEWKPELERSMEDFGDMFTGYYFIENNVRYVGFASVKAERRGEGHFKALPERFKEGVCGVVIISPSIPSRALLERLGYKYNEEHHVCFWERDECEGVSFVPPSVAEVMQ
jgi:hypothetical protein